MAFSYRLFFYIADDPVSSKNGTSPYFISVYNAMVSGFLDAFLPGLNQRKTLKSLVDVVGWHDCRHGAHVDEMSAV